MINIIERIKLNKKLKNKIDTYLQKVEKYNSLIEKHNYEIEKCFSHLQRIIELKNYSEIKEPELAESYSKEISKYIQSRENLGVIDEALDSAFSNLENLQKELGNKNIDIWKNKDKKTTIDKKINIYDILDESIENNDNAFKYLYKSTSEDIVYENKATRESLILKDLRNQIYVEFNGDFGSYGPGYCLPAKIYEEKTSIEEILYE